MTVRAARLFLCATALAAAGAQLSAQAAAAPLPRYRYRLLGVYDPVSGEPIEGAEVLDMLTRTSAQTSKTGTVTLVFLPDGGSVIRIRKVGYQPITMPVAISPDDTVPVTVTLTTSATTLPTVVTKDSAPRYLSPRLREFDERRKQGFGQFITDDELRKRDASKMTDVLRRFTGMAVTCRGSVCRASSTRQGSLGGSGCRIALYVDGIVSTDDNLEHLNVNEYAGVEFYAGGATIPPQYNSTKQSCGVLLLWSRER
ncbi:MAG: carboxypeptidase regulatory-like domain-containing protein [bacterium]